MEQAKKEVKPSSPEQIALARALFTEEEIKRCLKELQQQGQPSGLELKDFVSDLERLVKERLDSLPDDSMPYNVIYSDLVRANLQNAVIPLAKKLGMGTETLRAIKKIDIMLRVYPEYGEPLSHGTTESQQVRIAAIPPLCVLYGVDLDRGLVYVTQPLKFLPFER